MTRQRKSTQKVESDAPAATSDDLARLYLALDRFQPIDNSLLWRILTVIPWIMLFVAFYNVNQSIGKPGAVMWSTGFAMGALALLALQSMIRRIPTTFRSLWDRQIINVRSLPRSAITNNGDDPRPISLAIEYKNFIEASQRSFNSPYQYILGVLMMVFAIGWLLFQFGGLSLREAGSYYFLERIFIEGIPAFLGGILGWRMIVVGVQLWKVSKQFDISPQLGHPDQCGGLGVVGHLCFWNALISSIAGIYLGGWIIVGKSLPYFKTLGESSPLYRAYVNLAEDFTPLYGQELLVPIILSLISFFFPVWRIHQIMVKKKNDVQRQLDRLSESIDSLTRELLLNADKLDLSENEKITKKLERLRQIYNENKFIPVWPFNTKIILRFTAAQLVPILSLTGLGQEIVRLIASLLTNMIST